MKNNDNGTKNIIMLACAGSYKSLFTNPNMFGNNFTKNKIPVIVSPSVSPIKLTNPSYMTYEIKKQYTKPQILGYDIPQWLPLKFSPYYQSQKPTYQIWNVEINSLQLQYNIAGDKAMTWNTQKPANDWNFDFNFNYGFAEALMDQNSGVALDHNLETVKTVQEFG